MTGVLTYGVLSQRSTIGNGRLFGSNFSILNSFLERDTLHRYPVPIGMNQSSVYESPDGATHSIRMVKDIGGNLFEIADGVAVIVSRRTKQTTGSWTIIQTWASYTSQSLSCNFGLYDYLWEISDNS